MDSDDDDAELDKLAARAAGAEGLSGGRASVGGSDDDSESGDAAALDATPPSLTTAAGAGDGTTGDEDGGGASGGEQATASSLLRHASSDVSIPSSFSSTPNQSGGGPEHNPLWFGCRDVDCFDKINKIAEGTYGMVHLARDRKTNEVVALKMVKMDKGASMRDGFPITALRETNVLLALRHPNIVLMREMLVGSRHDQVFMVMEYYENDLKVVLGLQQKRNHEARVLMLGKGSVTEAESNKQPPFTIPQVKTLMRQFLSAMEFIHRCWFLHRDLKTANILYNAQGKLAVCDFGLARKYGDPVGNFTTNVVTLYYRCPELLLGAKSYSTAVDMWSVGCVFAEILVGHYFFQGTSEIDQLQKVFACLGSPTVPADRWPTYGLLPNAKTFKWRGLPDRSKLRDHFPAPLNSSAFTDASEQRHLSDCGFNLLEGLLCLDPEQRLSASEALGHEWFAEEPLPLPQNRMPVFEADHPTEKPIGK